MVPFLLGVNFRGNDLWDKLVGHAQTFPFIPPFVKLKSHSKRAALKRDAI